MAGQEDPPAAHPVGQSAERHGEEQEGGGRSERQQREPAVGDPEAPLQQQIDERVADRRQTQQQRADRDAAQITAAQQGQGGAQRRPGALGGRRGGRSARHEQHQHQDARHGHTEAHREHRVVPVDRGPQDQERHERAEQRARGVHRAVHAEGPATGLRCAGERDQGVARGGAQPLAGAVGGQDQADRRQGVGDQQQRFAQRRDAVTESGHPFVPAAAAVGEVPPGEPDECGETVVDAVEQSEAQRRQSEPRHQIQRKHRRDHLRGDVVTRLTVPRRGRWARPRGGAARRDPAGRRLPRRACSRGCPLRTCQDAQMPVMSLAEAALPAWVERPCESSRVRSRS